jgi:hypothetical protein
METKIMMNRNADPKAQLNRTRIRVAVFALAVLAVLAVGTAIPLMLIEGII